MKASHYVTTQELAAYVGVHRNTIARWRREGLLTGGMSSRHPNGIGRTTIYPRAALDQALKIQRLLGQGHQKQSLVGAK